VYFYQGRHIPGLQVNSYSMGINWHQRTLHSKWRNQSHYLNSPYWR